MGGTGNGGLVENYRLGTKKSIDGIVNQSCSGYQKQIGICSAHVISSPLETDLSSRIF
jgi:hypothetical protein